MTSSLDLKASIKVENLNSIQPKSDMEEEKEVEISQSVEKQGVVKYSSVEESNSVSSDSEDKMSGHFLAPTSKPQHENSSDSDKNGNGKLTFSSTIKV